VIVDPWGTVVAACPDNEGIAVAEIDLERFELDVVLLSMVKA
jgi:predicted amidohydrolase